MGITTASQNDIDALVALMNSAYRGEASKKGWTTEADMIDGTARTDATHLKNLLELQGATMLKYCNEQNDLEGCVFLQRRENKLYLGMLSVAPGLQAKGIGKELMLASEAYGLANGAAAVYMRVIDSRHELIAWYERRGYYDTGRREPFENSVFGTAKQPIEFIVMQKDLKPIV